MPPDSVLGIGRHSSLGGNQLSKLRMDSSTASLDSPVRCWMRPMSSSSLQRGLRSSYYHVSSGYFHLLGPLWGVMAYPVPG